MKRRRDERPEPALRAVRAVPGLVAIEDRLLRQHLLRFLIGRRNTGTDFFPCLLRTAETQRDLQGAVEESLHDEPWQPADDRQIRDQRRELAAKLTGEILRQRRQRRRAAMPPLPRMTAILRNSVRKYKRRRELSRECCAPKGDFEMDNCGEAARCRTLCSDREDGHNEYAG